MAAEGVGARIGRAKGVLRLDVTALGRRIGEKLNARGTASHASGQVEILPTAARRVLAPTQAGYAAGLKDRIGANANS